MTRFGIALPSGGSSSPPLTASAIAAAAREIEAAGFTSAWAFDSIGRGWLHADPLMALAVAATVTRDLEVGTGVLQVPLRNPVELAQRVLTAHVIAGGRLLLGVGAGSTAAGAPSSPTCAWIWRRRRRAPMGPTIHSICAAHPRSPARAFKSS